MPGGYVYILTNRKNGTLYTGVCANIAARMMQHRDAPEASSARNTASTGWSMSSAMTRSMKR